MKIRNTTIQKSSNFIEHPVLGIYIRSLYCVFQLRSSDLQFNKLDGDNLESTPQVTFENIFDRTYTLLKNLDLKLTVNISLLTFPHGPKYQKAKVSKSLKEPLRVLKSLGVSNISKNLPSTSLPPIYLRTNLDVTLCKVNVYFYKLGFTVINIG